MDWKRERDALIAQTYAFVQSVTAKVAEAPESDPQRPAPSSETRLSAVTPYQPLAQAEPEPATSRLEVADEPVSAIQPEPDPPPLTKLHSDERDEIRARIASFRAHQERFNRERAEYFSATIARLRAALDAVPPRGRLPDEARAPVSPRSSPGPAANIP